MSRKTVADVTAGMSYSVKNFLFSYTQQNVVIHATKCFHALHEKFLAVKRFVYTKKNDMHLKKDTKNKRIE